VCDAAYFKLQTYPELWINEEARNSRGAAVELSAASIRSAALPIDMHSGTDHSNRHVKPTLKAGDQSIAAFEVYKADNEH
jgi:hypothetical protein